MSDILNIIELILNVESIKSETKDELSKLEIDICYKAPEIIYKEFLVRLSKILVKYEEDNDEMKELYTQLIKNFKPT